jgi:hypothetical protein
MEANVETTLPDSVPADGTACAARGSGRPRNGQPQRKPPCNSNC